jgi:hypothetical protein
MAFDVAAIRGRGALRGLDSGTSAGYGRLTVAILYDYEFVFATVVSRDPDPSFDNRYLNPELSGRDGDLVTSGRRSVATVDSRAPEPALSGRG